MFDESVFMVKVFAERIKADVFPQCPNKHIFIETLSFAKYFSLIYKLLNTECCFVLSIKYARCGVILYFQIM